MRYMRLYTLQLLDGSNRLSIERLANILASICALTSSPLKEPGVSHLILAA